MELPFEIREIARFYLMAGRPAYPSCSTSAAVGRPRAIYELTCQAYRVHLARRASPPKARDAYRSACLAPGNTLNTGSSAGVSGWTSTLVSQSFVALLLGSNPAGSLKLPSPPLGVQLAPTIWAPSRLGNIVAAMMLRGRF